MHFSSFFFPTSKRRLNDRGVETLELAIILPVFFGLFFGVVDVARMVGGYSTVRAAVAVGARQAIGTQRTEWAVIPVLMGTSDKKAISAAQFGAHDEYASKAAYGSWYTTQISARSLPSSELYRVEMRAIAYANTIMISGIGQGGEYPCDTDPGCFTCFTLRGDEEGYKKYFSVEAGGGSRTWTARMLGLECEYQVPITLTSIALGWLPNRVPIRARIYIPIQNYAGSSYDPD